MYVKNAWYVAAWAADLAHELRSITMLEQPVLLYRKEDGTPVAMEDRCCHRRVPLSIGKLIGDEVQCGYHGFRFDAQGRCTHIPNQEQIPPSAKVRTFPVIEKHHLIWVWLGDPAGADERLVPDFSVLSDPTHAWKSDYMHAPCGYKLMVDNLNDLSHLAFVHSTTIGNAATAEAELVVEHGADHVTQTRWMINTPPPPTYQRLAGFEENIDRWQVVKFLPPTCIRIRTGGRARSNGERNFEGSDTIGMYVLHAITPETATTSHYFWAQTHNFRIDDPSVTERLFSDVKKAFGEDLVVFAAQQRAFAHDDGREEVSCRADGPQILARRLLARLVEAEAKAAV